MIATNFDSLQAARLQRNAAEVQAYFRALSEGQQFAQMDEQARNSDIANALAVQRAQDDAEKENYFRFRNNRDFAASQTATAKGMELDKRKLDIDERRYKELNDRADLRSSDQLFDMLYKGVDSGAIPDEQTLVNFGAKQLPPEKLSALTSLMSTAKKRRAQEYFQTARGIEAQFQSLPEGAAVLNQTDAAPFRNDYFKATGVYPEADPLFSTTSAKGIVDADRGWFTSDSDVAEKQRAIDVAAANAEAARGRRFTSFAAPMIKTSGLPLVANPSTMRLDTNDPDAAAYFAAMRGGAVQPSLPPTVQEQPQPVRPQAAAPPSDPRVAAIRDIMNTTGASLQQAVAIYKQRTARPPAMARTY